MIDINENELSALIGELDERIGKEGAFVRVEDNEYDGTTIVRANELGYLRLGVEFLKAAYASAPQGSTVREAVEVDLLYLFGQDSICYTFQRRESGPITPDQDAEAIESVLGGLAALVFVAFFFGSLVAGVPVVVGFVFGVLGELIKSIF